MIHSLGVLNWQIYDCISNKHMSDEVIITDEQLQHIRERHPEAYTDVLFYIRAILADPDYIFQDKTVNTGLIVKRIQHKKESAVLVLKIVTPDDKKYYKNSVLTCWKITEKRLENYLRNKNIIYRKE